MRSSRCLFLLLLVFFLLPGLSEGQGKNRVVMLIGTGDSLNVARAFKRLRELPGIGERYLFEYHTEKQLRKGEVDTGLVSDAEIILADFMKREADTFLAGALKGGRQKIYSLRCGYLADRIRAMGFEPGIGTEKYYTPATAGNIFNMILMVLSREGENVTYEPPFILPKSGLFHPDAPDIFNSHGEYMAWYRKSGRFRPEGSWAGITTFSTSASTLTLNNNGGMEADLIRALERSGINTLPVFGRPPYHESLREYFLDENENSRVDSICGFSFRFLRGFPQETLRILTRINAPVFMPLEAHSITIDQWKESEIGISPLRTAWQVSVPEQSGGIEPTLIGGKRAARLKGSGDLVYQRVSIPEQVDFLIKRVKAWHRLKAKKNPEKKIAILYWNHPPGKQNIGGSYMNCFASISSILSSLKKEGYGIEGDFPTEEIIEERILSGGRNVGSWAPGELDRLIKDGGAVRIPVSKYREWFKALPEEFRQNVVRQWGAPEDSNIMTKNGEIIIPLVDLGNIILVPQPSRGFGENPEKLYHDPKIYPHHQYIAFYLWLKKEFDTDAVISLGKHGTHEWLPGKQVGLSSTSPSEVLIQDIPNIYPYIVDNVGEGIQAKRRGRGVIIDHLIPPLEKGGAYMEYRELTALIDEWHNALVLDAALAGEKLATVRKLIRKTGIHKDLGLTELNREEVEEVEHYILELQETLIPYGLHTFGVSPSGSPLDHLAHAICGKSPEINEEKMKERLKTCGKNEIESLLRALSGGFIPAAEGNDPVRNPDAIPTGRNFYGFNMDKVPSREAFVLGKKLADGMIENYRKKHGDWPSKLGIILWSTELQRNEGAAVAAVFSLLGVTPVWDRKGQVVDIKPVPGALLKRPRIDVLVQSSGLFRDGYPKLIKLMDRAVRLAGSLKDVENFVAVNNEKIEKALLAKGFSENEARERSRARVFAPMPGAYSHALQELIPNSGVWEEEGEIADVFIHHYSYAYGDKIWGKPLKGAYKSNLKDVKVTLHTRSSNLYNMLDNDDMFAFLGGLSLAVKSQAGEYPDTLVANMQDKESVNLEDLPKSIGKALRTRYLNPRWIQGMKKEGYSGAKAMDEFVENLWGFQVTTPFAVDKGYWEEIHDVYIEDRYGEDLKAFFDKNNPWAMQSISARMLEADRKAYWKAPEEMKKNLARTYALNVIEKGVACCEHTCNNPMFQKYVTSIISLSGLLAPKELDQFKMVLAKATGRTIEEAEKQSKKARESLKKTIDRIQKEKSVSSSTEGKKIEGFEVVEEKPEDTKVTAAGSEWMVMVIVFGVLTVLFFGWNRKSI